MKNECADYSGQKTENSAWTFILHIMTWLSYNLKSKTKDGYCQSTNQGHGRMDPKCRTGSTFHNNLCNKCFKSFQEILDELEEDPPKPLP